MSAHSYYLWVKWDSDNNLNGEYDIFETSEDATAKWNATSVASGEKCACWEIEESNDWVYTQNQANSYLWK